jgi:hypothetical protein
MRHRVMRWLPRLTLAALLSSVACYPNDDVMLGSDYGPTGGAFGASSSELDGSPAGGAAGACQLGAGGAGTGDACDAGVDGAPDGAGGLLVIIRPR